MTELKNIEQISEYIVEEDRRLYSATHEEIRDGYTTDGYFVRLVRF